MTGMTFEERLYNRCGGRDNPIRRDAALIGREADQRIAELEAETAKLRSVMVAASEEIKEHWAAHCDSEGYGPVALLHRLEEGIPAEYGYTAGRFNELKEEVDRLRIQLRQADERVAYLRRIVSAAHGEQKA